jgi:DNA topoisomerase VI subunit B
MTDGPDMTAPVTRGEMNQALEAWARVLMDHARATAEKMAEKVAEKFVEKMAEKMAEMAAMIAASEQRLMAEIGRATKASAEELELRLQPMWMAAVGVGREQSAQELRAIDDHTTRCRRA